MPRSTAFVSGSAWLALAVLSGGASAADGGPAAPQAGAAPAWHASGAPAEGGYRWSLSRGALDVGVAFEPGMPARWPAESRLDSAVPLGANLASVSLGFTETNAGPEPASSLIERALGSGTGPAYVRKIGIAWKPAQSPLFFHQGLGVRLSGDDRLTMRLRKGSLGLYMQRNF